MTFYTYYELLLNFIKELAERRIIPKVIQVT